MWLRTAILYFITGFLLVALCTVGYSRHYPLVEAAQAHAKGFCGHGLKSGSVLGPYGYIQYNEEYWHGWGAGPHYHQYRVYAWNGYTWVNVHYHVRQCPAHSA